MRDDAIFEAARRMIALRDPEGLLDAGAPDDEYDSEVRDLVVLIRGKDVITAGSVGAVFDRRFGDASTWTSQCPGEVDQVAAGTVEKHIGDVFTRLGLPPDDARHRRVLTVPACLRA